jgi:hypothetical protein
LEDELSQSPSTTVSAILYDVQDPARLARLKSLELLDSPAEEGFDRLTRLASAITGAPIALVSLVDERRQFFKSAVGLPEPWVTRRDAPLSHSLCQHVVATTQPLIISDARHHSLVRQSLGVPELGVVAYAGSRSSPPQGKCLAAYASLTLSRGTGGIARLRL